MEERGRRKSKIGSVVSNKMNKSIVVSVEHIESLISSEQKMVYLPWLLRLSMIQIDLQILHF